MVEHPSLVMVYKVWDPGLWTEGHQVDPCSFQLWTFSVIIVVSRLCFVSPFVVPVVVLFPVAF